MTSEKLDGANPNRLFNAENMAWNELLGPFYDSALLSEYGLQASADLISVQVYSETFYPAGQFNVDERYGLQRRERVLEFWNRHFSPAIKERYADLWMSMAYLLQP